MHVYINGKHKCLSYLLMFYYPRRKGLHCLWLQRCLALYQLLQYVYLFSKVVNNQTPSLRQGVSLLRENINIFINVTYLYLYVTYLHIQDIQYDSITLYKGKILYKIFVWSLVPFILKELMIFISNL